jgi:uncharacterized membrane protein YfcA
LLWWLAYIALGLFTGLFAGMLGIGGGLVMVPTLTMMFAAQAGFPATEVLHLALGTSMAAILFTSLASLRAHHQHGAVLWKVVVQITPGILARHAARHAVRRQRAGQDRWRCSSWSSSAWSRCR